MRSKDPAKHIEVRYSENFQRPLRTTVVQVTNPCVYRLVSLGISCIDDRKHRVGQKCSAILLNLLITSLHFFCRAAVTAKMLAIGIRATLQDTHRILGHLHRNNNTTQKSRTCCLQSLASKSALANPREKASLAYCPRLGYDGLVDVQTAGPRQFLMTTHVTHSRRTISPTLSNWSKRGAGFVRDGCGPTHGFRTSH